jgi:hypothetical protein
MGLDQSEKIFLVTGIAILSVGYLIHLKDVGDSMGPLVMISGCSLMIGALYEMISTRLFRRF